MMHYLFHILMVLVCMTAGVTLLLGYLVTRMMKNENWDDSNMTNALRLLAHVTLHPEDFGKMYYIDSRLKQPLLDSFELKRPFWYVSKDELSEVVETRP